MEQLFQVESWEKHPNVDVHFNYYGQGNWQRKWVRNLERKSGINWKFIYENNGNQDKRKEKGHKLHVRRKMEENEGK